MTGARGGWYNPTGADGYLRETQARSGRRDSRGRYMRSGRGMYGRSGYSTTGGSYRSMARSGAEEQTVEHLENIMDKTNDQRVKEIIQDTIRMVENH